MLDGFIIDWLKRREEKKKRQEGEQPQVPLSLPDEETSEREDEGNGDEGNGIISIDMKDGYKVVNSYQ